MTICPPTPTGRLGAAVIACAGLLCCARNTERGSVTGGSTSVAPPVAHDHPAAAVHDPAAAPDAGEGFVIESFASYFGRNDFLLVVRSADASVELIDSPGSEVANPGKAIGRFRAHLPGDSLAKMEALLPEQLAPMPASSEPESHGPPRVMDAPTSGITVTRAGVNRPLVAPSTHEPSPELLNLLADARAEAHRHPVEAIRLTIEKRQDGFVFDLQSVGTGSGASPTLSRSVAGRPGSRS